MAFLRNLLASFVALLIFTGFLFFLFFLFLTAASSDDKPIVKSNSVLYLNLKGALIEERVPDDALADLFPTSAANAIGLIDVLRVIDEAKDDPKIKGIYMEHMLVSSGFASLKEIRDALIEFKESGKFLYAYGEFLSEGDFYLASVADELYLNPLGLLEFNGLSANVTFYKGLFEKLDIEPEIFRVGEFKSAVEPYLRKDLSQENKLQLSELLESVYSTYLNNLSESLEIDADKLREMSDDMAVRLPADAEKLGLVSKLAFEDEIKALVMEEVGEDDIDRVNFITYKNYLKSLGTTGYSKNKIAVIMANGEILPVGDPNTTIVGDKIANEIRKARENKSIKAIVLRVNSPGGSIISSDVIWREVELTKGVKPIIASMGNVAASGGYYISMLCDTIVAQPNTITGSIGIYSVMFNIEEFLENKMGITSDVVSTGDYSDFMSLTRQMTDAERLIMQNGVQHGYETFISKVANGRGKTDDEIKKIAGGRVWTGEQALEIGLVDIIGDFEDAINIAAEAAGVEDDYMVSYYPRMKPFFEQLFGDVTEVVETKVKGGQNHILTPYLEDLERLSRIQGVQARMALDIEIN